MINNTTSVTNAGGGLFTNRGTVTITVNGGAPVTVTDVTQAAANQTMDFAGFSDLTTNRAILFTGNSLFSAYDLTTAIGPVIGTPIISSPSLVDTNGGSSI
jgi:hypothetical protein